MERLSRVISIFVDLINNKIVDTTNLANKYEVSTRTIYRDLELLNLSGIPIISKSGNKGGFSIIEGFKVDKNILTQTEFSILLRGLQALINNQDKDARGVYDKLLSILETNKKEKIIKNSNNVIIDISPFEVQEDVQKNYKLLHQAIEEQKCIKIRYSSIDKDMSIRVIEPLVLLFKTSNWYLYAFCREKQAVRCFKISRIKEIEIIEESFEKREIEIKEFNEFFTDLEEVEIILKTDKKYAEYLQENHYVINKQEKDSYTYITLLYPLNNWVYSVLLGCGNRIEVISPKNVRNKIIKNISEMKKTYIKGEK